MYMISMRGQLTIDPIFGKVTGATSVGAASGGVVAAAHNYKWLGFGLSDMFPLQEV